MTRTGRRLTVSVLVTAVLLAGCSVTSQRDPGRGVATAGARSGGLGGRSPESGTVRILVEDVQGGTGEPALASNGNAVRTVIGRLAASRGVSMVFYDPLANPGDPAAGCDPQAGQALADANVVVLSRAAAVAPDFTSCALTANRPVVTFDALLWSKQALAASPGLVAPAAVSAAGWGAAAAKVLTGLPTRPRKVALLWVPSLDKEIPDAAGTRTEFLAGLRSTGMAAVPVDLPDPQRSESGYEAALALVPARLRSLGVDAIAAPLGELAGLVDVLARQKFTPPVVTGNLDPEQGQLYPAGRLHVLPLPFARTRAAQAVGSLLTAMKRTEAGRRCAGPAEQGGNLPHVMVLLDLLNACMAMDVITAVLARDPAAARSVPAFRAALGGLGPLELADGSVVRFGPDGRGVVSQLTQGVVGSGCACFTPVQPPVPLPVAP